MHRFWSARYPGHYANYHLPLDEKIKYGNEIDFAMREAENMLQDLMRFCEKNSSYQLWLLSSMGQAAVENHCYVAISCVIGRVDAGDEIEETFGDQKPMLNRFLP